MYFLKLYLFSFENGILSSFYFYTKIIIIINILELLIKPELIYMQHGKKTF
jgi:hypothetical protein